MPPALKNSKNPAPAAADSARNVAAPPGIELPSQVHLTAAGTVEGVPYLGAREIATLRFIYDYLNKRRHYPTRSEIAAGVMNSSKSGPTSPYLRRLLKLGYLARSTPMGHRNLRLTAAALERLALEGTAVNTQLNLSLPATQ